MSEILIVEDDLNLGQTLAQLFDNCGFSTQICRRLSSAFSYLNQHSPEVAIIDRVLPDGDGLEIVEVLQESSYKTKILILSQKAETISRVEGLAGGADDYLAKPFAASELKLRVLSLVNKTKHYHRQCLHHGPIKIYPNESVVEINQIPKKIRRKELSLLHCLLAHHDQVVTRQQLGDWLWGCQAEIPTRTALDVYVKRLRQHLGEYQNHLKTIRGFGYQLIIPPLET